MAAQTAVVVDKDELNKVVLGYLLANGYQSTHDALAKECGVASEATHRDVLRKNWTSIVKLQKQIFALEKVNQGMADELKKSVRGAKQSSSSALPRGPPMRTLLGHKDAIRRIVFHPIYILLVSCSDDRSVKVWDAETGKCERSLTGHTDSVLDAAFNPPGTILATSSADLSIKLWDFNSFSVLKTLNSHDHSVSCIKFSPSGDNLVSCSRDKTVKTWDISTGNCLRTMSGHDGWVRRIDVSPDGSLVASASMDENICIWNLKSGKLVHLVQGHEHVVESVLFSNAHADKVISESLKPAIGLSSPSKPLNDPNETANSSAAAADGLGGAHFFSVSRDNTVRMWNTATGKLEKTLLGHESWVMDVILHPSGKFLLTCGDDKSILVWDLTTFRVTRRIENAHKAFVSCVSWSPLMPMLASGGIDNVVNLWECT